MASSSAKKILNALTELTKQEAGPNHFEEFYAQTRGEKNHRGAAILLAANTEVALDHAIRRIIDKERQSILFRSQGALSSLRNKIHFGYGLGLFGKETFDALEMIREIRNAFAHAQIPISFEMPELIEACDLLPLQKFLPPHTVGVNDKDESALKGLERYRSACERIGHNLFVLNWDGIFNVRPGAIYESGIAPIPAAYNFAQVRQSLP